ncbi:hypothetical protein IU474_13650 [Nocardia otitidiscaviarum]|uniref:hypothetical protein n=1 Tax=Nocardia otitidiscaviarum TaxID=1823 RepID=UPI001894F10C|nr:hypothetical protein [Nocardia otitidiscaviarum]MBF6238107.1 hypothetical protein [Nocardia otitidiscaviarum]
MRQRRFAIGLGTAALLAGAVALAAPAYSAPHQLADGVSCDEYTCSNDTEDTYRIESEVRCLGFVVDQKIKVTTYVRPHTTATVTANCPVHREPPQVEPQPSIMKPDGSFDPQPPKTTPGKSYPSAPVAIRHLDAVVDNNPQPPSGSFG